ncbi:outer membrane beta-barrel protein [Ferruginibacter yonginensis]|uniref:Outer membrane beta-barrel protein n=1 Tax=Ferruginibacter yonginensis TaxID=1310416 RepID=A0ABV8QPG7_9BACT
MFKKIIQFFICILFIGQVSAQTSQISGFIKDTSSSNSVRNAVVVLLTPKDSVLKAFTRVQADGSYQLKNIPTGNYILSVTHPAYADFVDDISVKNTNETLANIALTPKSKLLEAVIVKSGSPIKLRGDTTVYTADSFKVSANANVEELLKKMPGIQVDKNGQIKALGQTVEKVLVDGEEFFGDDPGMAVKNLRADAVKEVQVFDKKSDQATFTGIDDGVTQKTINLKLKDNKKSGYFGKVDVAGGLQKNIPNRFNDNILLSSFKGKRKISGFLLNGNTGQDGLSWQDEEKFGGGENNFTVDDEGNYSYRGGSNDEEPYVNTENGFITNTNAGIQYSNKWNDKTTLNFSPKYNNQRYNNTTNVYRQTQIGDSVLNNNSNDVVNINRTNIKLKAIYDIKIDSFNTLKITGNANFYETNSTDFANAITTGKFGNIKNTSTRLLKNSNNKQALSGNVIYKHRFQKNRRTLSINTDVNNLNNEGDNLLQSNNVDVVNNTAQLIDQTKNFENNSSNINTRLIYTEPLSKNYALEIGYQLAINSGTNKQKSFAYNSLSAKYDTKVDSLSNDFKQSIIQNIPSLRLNYSYKKLKINVGAAVNFTNFDLKDISFNKTYPRNFTNFSPSASINFTNKKNKSYRFNYNGTTRQPTINQLQPLRNNNDQFNLFLGNPNLKPSFYNNFNISSNSYNFLKDLFSYQSLNASFISNSITNNRFIDANTGKTISQPTNTNGNFNLNYYGGFGFKAKKIDTRFNFNQNIGYNRFADVINNQLSFSNTANFGTSVYVSKSKEKKYDFSINNRIDYNVQTTSQNNNTNKYLTYSAGADATVYYKKVWSISTDFNIIARQKTAQIPGLTNSLWNAKLQRTFKSDEFTVYGVIRDILNQNIGIDRNFYSNTFTETRNDRLKRYFMLGFAWNFKNKAPKAN